MNHTLTARFCALIIGLGVVSTTVEAQTLTINLQSSKHQIDLSALESSPTYRIDAMVSGDSYSSVSFTPAAQSPVALTGSSGSWNFTQSNMASATYPLGVAYTWNANPGVLSNTITAPSAFFTASPVTPSQGSWVNPGGPGPNWLLVDSAASTTFTFSLPAGFTSDSRNHISFSINGGSVSLGSTWGTNAGPSLPGSPAISVSGNTGTITFGAGTLDPSGDYNVIFSLNQTNTATDFFGTGVGTAYFTLETAVPFELKTTAAVPEPGTSALIFGVLAFGTVVCRRRRV